MIISTSPTSRDVLEELQPLLTEVMGGEKPICSYDLQSEGLEESAAMPTIEWDIVAPEERLKKIMDIADRIVVLNSSKLEKFDVLEQMRAFPPEIMKKFVESVTGMPSNKTDSGQLIMQISNLPDDQYKKFMSSIDPDVQRQLTFQLVKQNPDFLTLFKHKAYGEMLNTLMKPEMIKPMIMLQKETLVKMISQLPEEFMSVVAAQVDTKEFAKFLQRGHMDLIEEALML